MERTLFRIKAIIFLFLSSLIVTDERSVWMFITENVAELIIR